MVSSRSTASMLKANFCTLSCWLTFDGLADGPLRGDADAENQQCGKDRNPDEAAAQEPDHDEEKHTAKGRSVRAISLFNEKTNDRPQTFITKSYRTALFLEFTLNNLVHKAKKL